MKNFNDDQILKNEELSKVLGGASSTNILFQNDEPDFDAVGAGCNNKCSIACSGGCESGCSPGCVQTSAAAGTGSSMR